MFRKASRADKGLRGDVRVFKELTTRLRPGHGGCADDEPGAFFDRASKFGHDQVDGYAQVKREKTGEAGVD